MIDDLFNICPRVCEGVMQKYATKEKLSTASRPLKNEDWVQQTSANTECQTLESNKNQLHFFIQHVYKKSKRGSQRVASVKFDL